MLRKGGQIRIEGSHLVFESGKKVYAYQGIVGVAPNGSISGGYDQMIREDWNIETEEFEDILTPEMKRELAECMVEKWSQLLE